jgi:Phage integrase family
MNQAVYDVLSALPKSGRRLFPSSIRRAFENAVERAGVKDFRFHDLRHTFASWLTMKGRPLREVQELLGHKSIYMTQRYSHLAPERLREGVAVLDNTMSAHRPFEATQLPATVGERYFFLRGRIQSSQGAAADMNRPGIATPATRPTIPRKMSEMSVLHASSSKAMNPPVHSTSRTISISTGMFTGSPAIPTAERACLPMASPNTSTIRSEKPLITFG